MNQNDLMIWLLTSPAHGLVSHNMTVLHVRGRNSDRLYHVPVTFVQTGETLTVISNPNRTWWRNLAEGAHLSLHLRGENVSAYGTVLRDPQAIETALADFVWERPGIARTLGVGRAPNGTPDAISLRRAASEWVVIQLHLRGTRYPTQMTRAHG